MIMADNFNNNLIMIIPQIVEVIVIVSSMPQLLGLESGSGVDMVGDYYLTTFSFGQSKLVLKPVGD
jgi:hypothetical protein